MSVIVTSEVRRRLNLKGGIFTLALELADTANHNGEGIFRSAGSLAKFTRQGKRTVHRQLDRLRELGWLVMVRRKHSSKYPVPLYAISADWIRGASLATLPDIDLQSCQPKQAELPSETGRVATGGNQSVLTHPYPSSGTGVPVNPVPARAIPTGSRGARSRSTQEVGLKIESLHTRMKKAKALLESDPEYPVKKIRKLYVLNDEQIATAMRLP
jgi:hypothetical protein